MSVLTPLRPKPRFQPDSTPPLPEERLTCAEFHDRMERGVYGERRLMLIRGEVRELEPMNPPHATACEIAAAILGAIFNQGCHIRQDKPLCLDLDTDPEPDVFLAEGAPRDYRNAHPTRSGLVMEVSDATLTDDLGEKKSLYALGKVPDYWVLDLNRRRLHVFREPAGDSYSIHLIFDESDTVAPLAKPEADIKVADLLP